jgi:hypothetical protein
MLIPNKFNGYHNGTRQLHISSGGGGGGQTTSTVQNTNVPEYAKPYVEGMLGATQEQLFRGTRGPDVTNPETGEVSKGMFNIEGFKPYQAYGGTYRTAGEAMKDPSGNPILNPDGTPKTYQGGEKVIGPDGKPIYDAGLSVAGFSPMQTAAQQGIAGMQMPGQFGAASDFAAQAGMGGLRSAQDAMRFGEAGFASGQKGQELGIAGGQKYGEMGAGYGALGAGYGAQAADIGKMGLRAETYGRQVSGQAEDYARQAAGAGQQYAQQATSPQAMQAYMSPYMQNVVDVQNREAARASGIIGTQQQAQATQAGAYGGGRDAIMRAERERNLAMLQNQNQAQGMQAAYQQAQQAQQFGANLGLQGLQGAQQGLGTALQGGQLGLSGIGTALQGMQGGMQGAGIGIQGAQTGLQGVDRQLAGTGQGMQGAQVGLQGVSGAQAGYGLANQAGTNLANIGSQQQQAQLGIYGAQNAAGAQQQALEQQKINQAMQDYANEQQYPLMQLGTMSNMLRGLPMQASTTNQYQAAPNQLTQAIGTIGSGASIYNAMKPGGGAAGGLPSEFKYAKGGIMSYDMGGEVEEQLESMDEKGLEAQARESTSPSIRKMAQRILRERQMSKQPQGTGPMGVQYQAAQPQMPSYAPGGIVAFAQGKTVYGGPSTEADEGEAEARIGMEERLAMPPTTAGGIMGATAQPATPVPVAPAGPSPDVVKEAMRQRDLNTVQANRSTADVIKEIQAERDASGIGDNKAREEYRSQQMAERANMKDEQERQRHMRLAEFFASWGSTPGPTLVAGMNALKQSIPGLITDQKEAKKARREADKIIYDIDESTRLDKLGMHNEATARREKAAKQAEEYNKYLLTFQSQRESDKRALEQTTMTTEAQRYVADSQAKSQSGYNAQRAKEVEYRNIEVSLNAALRQKADIEKDIEATRSRPPKGSPLAKAMDTANLYNSLLSKNGGDASKLDAITRKNGEQALETINKFETNAARRLREAENRVQTFENLFDTAGRGSKSGAKTSGSKDDPFEIMDILKSESPASAASANAPANAPAKTSTSRTGDASSVNPYVDTKGKARPDAPRGEPSKASKLVDEAVPVVKYVANKVANELSGSELRYLKDKIARNEKLSVTDRIRAERAGLL